MSRDSRKQLVFKQFNKIFSEQMIKDELVTEETHKIKLEIDETDKNIGSSKDQTPDTNKYGFRYEVSKEDITENDTCHNTKDEKKFLIKCE